MKDAMYVPCIVTYGHCQHVDTPPHMPEVHNIPIVTDLVLTFAWALVSDVGTRRETEGAICGKQN